jgi:hypothetical protein
MFANSGESVSEYSLFLMLGVIKLLRNLDNLEARCSNYGQIIQQGLPGL